MRHQHQQARLLLRVEVPGFDDLNHRAIQRSTAQGAHGAYAGIPPTQLLSPFQHGNRTDESPTLVLALLVLGTPRVFSQAAHFLIMTGCLHPHRASSKQRFLRSAAAHPRRVLLRFAIYSTKQSSPASSRWRAGFPIRRSSHANNSPRSLAALSTPETCSSTGHPRVNSLLDRHSARCSTTLTCQLTRLLIR